MGIAIPIVLLFNISDSTSSENILAADSVAMLGCFPKELTVSEAAAGICKFSFIPEKGDEVVVCENKDDEHFLAPRSQCVKIPVSNGLGEYRIRDQKCRKIIFKLKKDGRLVDEVIITR